MTPPKLTERNGVIIGANVTQNSPFPCPNGNSGGMNVPGGVQGVIMHTMVGNLPGTISVFNNPSFQASAHFGVGQDGQIHQFGPVNGWKAWHAVSGNPHWYGIEHADNGNPSNPLTPAQIAASAQLVEVLSRVGNFPLQVTDSTGGEGYGVHHMGGAAWGGHTCPDTTWTDGIRSNQRAEIIALAKAIRGGVTPPPPPPPSGPPVLKLGASGADVTRLQVRLNLWGAALAVDGSFGPVTQSAVRAFQASHHLTVDGVVGPVTWGALNQSPPKPGDGKFHGEYVTEGLLDLAHVAAKLGCPVNVLLRATAVHYGSFGNDLGGWLANVLTGGKPVTTPVPKGVRVWCD